MMLVSNGFKERFAAAMASVFNGGAIQIYTGSRPSTPNDLPSTSPIATITNYGLPWSPSVTSNGLNFIAQGPYIVGDPTQTWMLIANEFATLGNATWWRLMMPGDTGLPSLDNVRLDGDIGLKDSPAGQEILLDSLTLTPGDTIPFNSFFYAIPPL